MVDGKITSYRRGKHTQYTNQMVLQVRGIDSLEKAQGLVGKGVIWTSPAKKNLVGRITRTHGTNGALLARFQIGMPGQSLGQNVRIE
ncbi:50S ribosomal protein L35ae [Candidatus Woesearchaeota archaeon]|nr:50S ribosomal protein L35ae [Candidatus Woesearchaeota archaeon]